MLEGSTQAQLLSLEVEPPISPPLARSRRRLWTVIGLTFTVVLLAGAGTFTYFLTKPKDRTVKPTLEVGQEMKCKSLLSMEDQNFTSNITFLMLPLKYEGEETVFLGLLKEPDLDVPFYFRQKWLNGTILPTACIPPNTSDKNVDAIRSILKILNDSVAGDRTKVKPFVGGVMSEQSSLSDQDMINSYKMKATLGQESVAGNSSFKVEIPKMEVSSSCARSREWKPDREEISKYENVLNNCTVISTIVPSVQPVIENKVGHRAMETQQFVDTQELKWPAEPIDIVGYPFQIYCKVRYGEYLSVDLGMVWSNTPKIVKSYDLSYSRESTYNKNPFYYALPVSTFVPLGPIAIKLSLSFSISFGIIGDFKRTTATLLHGELGASVSAGVTASASVSVLLAEAGIRARGQAVSGAIVVRFYRPKGAPLCLELYKKHNTFALAVGLYLKLNYIFGSKTWEKVLYEKSSPPHDTRLYGGRCYLPW